MKGYSGNSRMSLGESSSSQVLHECAPSASAPALKTDEGSNVFPAKSHQSFNSFSEPDLFSIFNETRQAITDLYGVLCRLRLSSFSFFSALRHRELTEAIERNLLNLISSFQLVNVAAIYSNDLFVAALSEIRGHIIVAQQVFLRQDKRRREKERRHLADKAKEQGMRLSLIQNERNNQTENTEEEAGNTDELYRSSLEERGPGLAAGAAKAYKTSSSSAFHSSDDSEANFQLAIRRLTVQVPTAASPPPKLSPLTQRPHSQSHSISKSAAAHTKQNSNSQARLDLERQRLNSEIDSDNKTNSISALNPVERDFIHVIEAEREREKAKEMAAAAAAKDAEAEAEDSEEEVMAKSALILQLLHLSQHSLSLALLSEISFHISPQSMRRTLHLRRSAEKEKLGEETKSPSQAAKGNERKQSSDLSPSQMPLPSPKQTRTSNPPLPLHPNSSQKLSFSSQISSNAPRLSSPGAAATLNSTSIFPSASAPNGLTPIQFGTEVLIHRDSAANKTPTALAPPPSNADAERRENLPIITNKSKWSLNSAFHASAGGDSTSISHESDFDTGNAKLFSSSPPSSAEGDAADIEGCEDESESSQVRVSENLLDFQDVFMMDESGHVVNRPRNNAILFGPLPNPMPLTMAINKK